MVLVVVLFALWDASTAEASSLGGERESTASCYGYGDGLAGNLTASGVPFDPESDTVAHKWLPFGTPVAFRVGEAVAVGIVRDRGPYVGDREFDMSCGLMGLLGLPPGVYPVMVS